jgi:DNA-binding NarL/FixJ family response regulator
VRVLIVHDHAVLASEFARILTGEGDLAVVGISLTGEDGLKSTAQYQPDVVLMDYRLPDITGPSAARVILAAQPAPAIVFHSVDDSETALLDAVEAGATAYLTGHSSAEQIVEAVRRAARGDLLFPVELLVKALARQRQGAAARRQQAEVLAEFTPRELEVLQLLATGLDTTGMARRLGIAPHTIEWHVRHLIEKLHVHSKLQAVIAAARLGLIELTGSS